MVSRLKTLVTWAIIVFVFIILIQEVAKLDWVFESKSSISIATRVALYSTFILSVHFALSLGWLILLRLHAIRPSWRRLFYAFFVPNLGKYVPGKVLFALGRIELTHKLGARRRTAISCFLLENLFLVICAAIISLPAIFALVAIPESYKTILILLAAAVLVFFAMQSNRFVILLNRVFGKRSPASFLLPLPMYSNFALLLYYMVIWVVYGIAGCILAAGIFDISQNTLLVIASAFVASWLGGFLAFFTPAGLGVREGLLVALLVNILEPGEASLLALASRTVWTITELSLGALFLCLPSPKTMGSGNSA